MQVDGIDPTEPGEHADPQGRGHGHPPSIEPSPLEDVRAEDAVIDANEPTPEDERVEELLEAPSFDVPELAEAVEQQDAELATLVIADDDRIDGRYLEINQSILTMLATQAPVATDLRLISAMLHVIHSVERMGDQCVNIAKVIPLTGNDAPQRAEMIDRIVRMGQQARGMLSQAKKAFENRDLGLARDLVHQDDLIDQLNKECFQVAVQVGDDADIREWAMTMTLVARALERIGDNSVGIGEQVIFVETGLFREFPVDESVVTDR
jgi:phosphate transport system protein